MGRSIITFIRNRPHTQAGVLYVLLFMACLTLYIKRTLRNNESTIVENKRDEHEKRLQAEPQEEMDEQDTQTVRATEVVPNEFKEADLKVQTSDGDLPFRTEHIKYCEDIFPDENAQKQMMAEFNDVWEQVRAHDDYVSTLRLSLKHLKGKCYVGHTLSFPEEVYTIAKLVR